MSTPVIKIKWQGQIVRAHLLAETGKLLVVSIHGQKVTLSTSTKV